MVKNAGKYKHKISIYKTETGKDADGFPITTETLVFTPYAEVKTTSGITLIASGSDFEKALTRFVIRYSPKVVEAYEDATIARNLTIHFNNRVYTVEYLNNIDYRNEELELQGKAVSK